MIDPEHARKVFAHQEQQQLFLEMAERLIAMENKLAGLESRTKEKMDDFLRGATNLSVRFDRLETKLFAQELKKQGTTE